MPRGRNTGASEMLGKPHSSWIKFFIENIEIKIEEILIGNFIHDRLWKKLHLFTPDSVSSLRRLFDRCEGQEVRYVKNVIPSQCKGEYLKVKKSKTLIKLYKLYTWFQALQVQIGLMPKSSFNIIKTKPARKIQCIALSEVTDRLRRELIASPYPPWVLIDKIHNN